MPHRLRRRRSHAIRRGTESQNPTKERAPFARAPSAFDGSQIGPPNVSSQGSALWTSRRAKESAATAVADVSTLVAIVDNVDRVERRSSLRSTPPVNRLDDYRGDSVPSHDQALCSHVISFQKHDCDDFCRRFTSKSWKRKLQADSPQARKGSKIVRPKPDDLDIQRFLEITRAELPFNSRSQEFTSLRRPESST